MATREERAQQWLDRRADAMAAITAGIAQAERSGLTKDYDVAAAVLLALDNSELAITRKR